MDKNKQITINQHYLPRFYMKNFSFIKGKGKKEKVLTSFYQFDKNMIKNDIPTKSICFQKNFYGEDGLLEKKLSEKEKVWASTIQKIITSNEYLLDDSDEKDIKEFIMLQYCRTLAMQKHNEEMLSQMVDEISVFEKNIKNYNFKLHPSELLEIGTELIKEIDDLCINIIEFKTLNKLIISDMPVLALNPLCFIGGGIGLIGTFILCPVSNEKIVCIYDEKIYKNCDKYMVIENEEDVINLNKYQVLSANNYIISRYQKDLSIVLNDEVLFSKRKKTIDDRRIEKINNGEGMILGTKAININYYFELSFCKLLKYLRNIPNGSKVSISRKYSEDMRNNLLFRAYVIPNLIKKNRGLTDMDISKLKKGYLKMQRIMDEYWDIPMKDRTITPTLIKKLNKYNIEYYQA